MHKRTVVHIDGAADRKLIVADKVFRMDETGCPFRYLVDDYGLSYYTAFVGCSAETEASFETISFLAKKMDELNLPCVLTIEGVQHILTGEHTYPNDYPELGSEITVTGTFEVYTESGFQYCRLKDATIEK